MLVVYSTCPDLKSAEKVAGELVKSNIAACINIIKIENSFYVWKGKLRKEKEYLLIMKVPKGKYAKLERAIKKIHPYDVPELVAVKADKVFHKYKKWAYKVRK